MSTGVQLQVSELGALPGVGGLFQSNDGNWLGSIPVSTQKKQHDNLSILEYNCDELILERLQFHALGLLSKPAFLNQWYFYHHEVVLEVDTGSLLPGSETSWAVQQAAGGSSAQWAELQYTFFMHSIKPL